MCVLHFLGPFDLSSDVNDLLHECPVRGASGIYLWAIRVDGKYLVTYVGETGTSFYRRTKEHLIQTLGGNYRIYDATAMRQGIQEVAWDGLWRKGTRDKFPEFLRRYEELAPRIKEYLQSKVVFVAVTECDRLLRRRIEGAIASALRSDSVASCLLPSDIRFRMRRSDETPVDVTIESGCHIIGLPSHLIV